MDAQDLRQLKPELDVFLARYAPLFGRDEAPAPAQRFVQGLLLGGERRSVEHIAAASAGSVVRSLPQFIAQSGWQDATVRPSCVTRWRRPGTTPQRFSTWMKPASPSRASSPWASSGSTPVPWAARTTARWECS